MVGQLVVCWVIITSIIKTSGNVVWNNSNCDILSITLHIPFFHLPCLLEIVTVAQQGKTVGVMNYPTYSCDCGGGAYVFSGAGSLSSSTSTSWWQSLVMSLKVKLPAVTSCPPFWRDF